MQFKSPHFHFQITKQACSPTELILVLQRARLGVKSFKHAEESKSSLVPQRLIRLQKAYNWLKCHLHTAQNRSLLPSSPLLSTAHLLWLQQHPGRRTPGLRHHWQPPHAHREGSQHPELCCCTAHLHCKPKPCRALHYQKTSWCLHRSI